MDELYCSDLYKEILGESPSMNDETVESALDGLIPKTAEIRKFWSERSWLIDRLKEDWNDRPILRDSCAIYVYYLAVSNRMELYRLWPLTNSDLAPFYTHLGIAMPD